MGMMGGYCFDALAVVTLKKLAISRNDAEKLIHDIDKHRREYFKYYTGNDWESAKNYDLCLDTSKFGIHKCVDIIADVVMSK